MKRLLAIACSFLLAVTVVMIAPDRAAAASGGKLLMVLDSSGSMKEPAAGGMSKIDAAKKALNTVVDKLPSDAQVGMRVYGAKVFKKADPGACQDSQLVVPVGKDNRDQLRSQISSYKPYGETPIAYSLKEAAKDLGSEGKRSILLISDGEENCDPDPCAVAKNVVGTGIDLRIDVVGFRVSGKAQEQLKCIAAGGKGTYYDVDNADDLTRTVEQVKERAVKNLEFVGTPVTGAELASQAPPIGAGTWTDVAGEDTATKFYRITRTTPGSTIWVGLQMRASAKGASLKLGLKASDGTGCDSASAWRSGGGSTQGALITGSLSSSVTEESCRNGDLTFGVSQEAISSNKGSLKGNPYQLTVIEEPPVKNANQLTGAPDPKWEPAAAGPTRSLNGGNSTTNAPLIAPATINGAIVPGEIQLYKVKLDWGQRIQARLEMPDTPDYPEGYRQLDLRVLNPLGATSQVKVEGAPSDRSYESTAWHGQGVDLATGTPQLRWPNRLNSDHQRAALPGEYLIAVSYSDDESKPTQRERKFTLGVQVIGQAGTEAPQYAEAGAGSTPGSDPSSTPSDGTTPPANEPPPTAGGSGQDRAGDSASDNGEPSALQQALPWLIGGGAAALLMLGGIAVGVRFILRRQ